MTETLRRGYPGMKVDNPRPTGCGKSYIKPCQGSGAKRLVRYFNAISCRLMLRLTSIFTTVGWEAMRCSAQ